MYTTTVTGANACATIDLNAIWEFINSYSWLWGAGMIVIGAFMCFFGRKLFIIALFIATMIVVAMSIMMIFYFTFLDTNTEEWVGWVVLGCSVLVGALAGYLMTRVKTVGAAILAGWGGFMLGMLLNEMVLYKFQSEAVFWIVCISCAVIAGLLTICLFDWVLIVMTAFAGSYCFWRGISMYAGGFPNEFTLAKEIQEGSIDSIPGWFYAYMVAIVLTCGLGAWFQNRNHDHSESNDNPYRTMH